LLLDEETAFGRVGREFDRAVVGIGGFAGAAEAGEEVGACCVVGLVVGEPLRESSALMAVSPLSSPSSAAIAIARLSATTGVGVHV